MMMQKEQIPTNKDKRKRVVGIYNYPVPPSSASPKNTARNGTTHKKQRSWNPFHLNSKFQKKIGPFTNCSCVCSTQRSCRVCTRDFSRFLPSPAQDEIGIGIGEHGTWLNADGTARFMLCYYVQHDWGRSTVLYWTVPKRWDESTYTPMEHASDRVPE